MTWLSDEELEEYSRKYEQIKEKTREEYEQGDYHGWDDLWMLAQSFYSDFTSDGQKSDPIESGKIAAAALHTVGYEIDWGEARERINLHVLSSAEGIEQYSPLNYAVQAGDEIVNHAVASELQEELDIEE